MWTVSSGGVDSAVCPCVCVHAPVCFPLRFKLGNFCWKYMGGDSLFLSWLLKKDDINLKTHKAFLLYLRKFV